ncbi:glycoside hydrolase family 3 N-terminal domain-containing protein [Rhizosphaericola mali]|uniref:Beta-glucosidase n=1 Tax=Rhizosphaericola mali TaxID=2545455 RepID=A0A5P2G549_9BACT|nr:glycoside hydrolase family 3 N-terminal domain-containing protein [Rhizosphaericola mali]QES88223.1 beta-glucosidase [Rhizosphaericola mali]
MRKVFLLLSLSCTQFGVFGQKTISTSTPITVQTLLSKMSLDEKINELSAVFGWEMYSKTGNTVATSEKLKSKQYLPGMFWGTLRADPWTRVTLKTGLTVKQAVEVTNAIQKYATQHDDNHIPIMLAEEGMHGVMAIGTTVFPTAIGQASTWDTALIRKMGQAIAAETRSQGSHIVYGPILDLAREPRWSRVEETFGEDPELVMQMGVAMVQGLQNGPFKTISTLKHFAAYGMSDAGQNGGSVTLGKRDLNENILYPFKAAVKAGVGSVMTSYNSIDGIPCTSDSVLFTDILRKQWHFNGFTVSDLGSIEGIFTTHNTAKSLADGASQALKAGVDTDLGGNGFGKNLKEAYDSGWVSLAQIDTAVGRLLKAKIDLGLFENPYVDVKIAEKIVRSKEHIQIARDLAKESVVLLKNEPFNRKVLLPLSKSLKNIAIIGPNADNMYNQLGDYTAPQDPNAIITVLKGIKNKLPNANINYVKGCNIRDTTEQNIEAAVNATKNAEVAIVVVGGSSARDFKTEYKATGAATVKENGKNEILSDMESGEGYDRTSLDLMGLQNKLIKAIVATGKPVVLVTIEGRPLNINWPSEHVPAILAAWYPGQEGGNGIADVLFGDYNPSGRLPITIPRSVGQLPVYYNHDRPVKHNYVEESAKPLFAFGYGLSYSKFDYSNLHVEHINDGENLLKVSFKIKNVSNIAGTEIPQLYVHTIVSSTVKPEIQLRNFSHILLQPQEEKEVVFYLNKEKMQTFGKNEQWSVEHGPYEICIGSSSDNLLLKETVSL